MKVFVFNPPRFFGVFLMPVQNDIERLFAVARLRAERKMIFIKHFFLFLAANFFLFIADLVFWPGILWFHWPLLGWGFFLGVHGSVVALKERPGGKSKKLLTESGARKGGGK
jgi:hypothetical protein